MAINFDAADAIGTIKAVLESGNSIEIPATGYSMFPTLHPGDRVIVKPLTKGELPEPGSVVVYTDGKRLVMHRLIEISQKEGELKFITRGDSQGMIDNPWTQNQLLGVAYSYIKNRKEHHIRSFLPMPGFYRINRRILWLLCRIRRVIEKFTI